MREDGCGPTWVGVDGIHGFCMYTYATIFVVCVCVCASTEFCVFMCVFVCMCDIMCKYVDMLSNLRRWTFRFVWVVWVIVVGQICRVAHIHYGNGMGGGGWKCGFYKEDGPQHKVIVIQSRIWGYWGRKWREGYDSSAVKIIGMGSSCYNKIQTQSLYRIHILMCVCVCECVRRINARIGCLVHLTSDLYWFLFLIATIMKHQILYLFLQHIYL